MLLPDWPWAKYSVTVIIDCARALKSRASLYTALPFGTVTEAAPPLKVKPLRTVVLMLLEPALPSLGTLMEADVMGRSDPPKMLEI
jgi:hypothetical protein